MRLVDVDPKAFQSFFYWLNTGMINLYLDSSGLNTRGFAGHVVKAYIFSDYHGVQKFKNAVLDALYLDIETNRKRAMINSYLIYDNTVDGDSLRKLFINIGSESWNLKSFKKEYMEAYHKEFLFDFILALKEKNLAAGAEGFDRVAWVTDMRTHFCARYHDHATPEARHEPDAA